MERGQHRGCFLIANLGGPCLLCAQLSSGPRSVATLQQGRRESMDGWRGHVQCSYSSIGIEGRG